MSAPQPPARPPLFYLVGTSAHPNYGDELSTAGWLRFLAKTHPDTPVVLDCPQPGLASFLFEGMHPDLRTTDLLWRTIWEAEQAERDGGPEAADALVDQRVEHLGFPRYDLAMLAARRATKFHVLGGSYFADFWPQHVRLLRALTRLRTISGATVSATGLSLLPSPDPDRIREYLSAFDYVSVTDQPSRDLLGSDVDAPVVGDDCLLDLSSIPGYTNRASTAAPGEKGDIWVSIQRDLATQEAFDATVDKIRALLTSPLAEGRQIHYLEALPGGDRYAFDLLSDLIPEANFVPFVRLWHEGFPARPRQIWLTTRYRVHLLAAACGAAGLAIPVEPDYYPIKHDGLVAYGTGWRVTAPEAELEKPSGGHEFRMAAARMQRQKLAEAERIYPRVARAR